MPIARVLLDWNQPALRQTAGFLFARFGGAEELDLRRVIVTLPTAQAGRRLLELLVEEAARRSWTLVPPRLITLKQLPELLYVPKRPFAETLTQQFAWVQAIRTLRGPQRVRLMRRLPDATLLGWLAFAAMLSDLHRELVASNLDFSRVANQIKVLGEPREIARWELLQTVEAAYLNLLDNLGLWDRQTARLVALNQQEFTTDCDVVLVGAVDLNASQRAMLEQVADRVTALVFADNARADWFDEFGGLITERWQTAAIDHVFERTEVVDGPDDQALAACRVIASWNDRFSAEDVTIGLGDRRIAPALEQRLNECGLSVHNALGRSLIQTGPARVLSAAADVLESQTFRDFANLARHPAVESWLAHRGVPEEWLLELDDYSANRFPARMAGSRSSKRPSSAPWRTTHYDPALGKAVEQVGQLLGALRGRPQAVNLWMANVRELLVSVHAVRPLDRDNPQDHNTWTASEMIQEVLATIEDLPAELAPKVNGAEALRLVLRELDGPLIFDPPGENEVALCGWFDLPWDDAPALVVTGMNEGLVPTSQSPDAFLPNGLRRQMRLDDNDRRLARDAYALNVLAASRQALRLILGRRTAENDPLSPSRLLFACEERAIPERVQALFSRPPSLRGRVRLPDGLEPSGANVGFVVPRPEPLPEPISSMRVTEFSAYLECPYRYYLAHQLKLKSPGASAEELPPNAFGDLIHDVLETFGQTEPINRADEAGRLYEFLSDTLTTQAQRKFGRDPLPAVRLQIELARLRLKGFADWQAEWAGAGWEIRFTEQAVKDERAFLLVDDEPMYLRGRIDRIDVREHNGRLEVTVLDYKTADAGASPDEKHRDKEKTWKDLQLPLYRHLLKAVEGVPETESVQMGYVVLPKSVSAIGERLADWTLEDLAEADRVAAEVVRKVRREEFWPPNPNVRYFAEFSAICQDDLFGSAMQGEEP